MSRLRAVIAFEWRHQVRQPAFAAGALALGGFAAVMVATGYGPAAAGINSPYVVMLSLGLLSLMATFVVTFFAAAAALRDREHRMHELLFATPLTIGDWYLGRWLGVLAASLAVTAVAAVVLMAGPFVLGVDPERVGALRAPAYLHAMALMVIPNLVLVSSVLFVAAARSQSAIVTYLGGVAIWAAFWVTALVVDSPILAGAAPAKDALARAAILDPFGLSAFFEQTRYWTPGERNSRLLMLDGRMLLNRLLWLAVAALIMVTGRRNLASRVLHPRLTSPKAPVDKAGRAAAQSGAEVLPLSPLAVFGHIARLELRLVLGHWSFMAVLAIWVAMVGIEIISEIGSAEYGARLLPTTALVIDRMSDPLALIGRLVGLYFAADLVWRDRLGQIHHLIDATPAAAVVRMLGKLTALLILPVILLATGLLTGTIIQAALGYRDLRLDVLLPLFWYLTFPLMLFAVAAFALQVIVPDRWIAMLGGIMVAVLGMDGTMLGVNHPMLRYAAFPVTPFSDFDGFGAAPRSFAAFAAWWTTVAGLLLLVSWGLWRHGSDVTMRSRIAAFPRMVGPAGGRIAKSLLVLLVATAVWLAPAVARTTRFPDRDSQLANRAEYERSYRSFHWLPHPAIVAARIAVDLELADRRAGINGELLLVNNTGHPVDSIMVAIPREAAAATVVMDGATVVRRDPEHGVLLLVFAPAMAPDDSARLTFSHLIDRGGIHADAPPRDVTGNGTRLMSSAMMPTLGYRPELELQEARDRKARQLTGPPLVRLRASEVAAAPGGTAWLRLDLSVGTAPEQSVVAQGTLVARWDSAGKAWYRYRTAHEITPVFGFLSAVLTRQSVSRGGITVEVWHHPGHGVNVPRIAEAALRSVEVLSPRLGALPDTMLRIVEVPRWAAFGAMALSGMILFPESRGFLVDEETGPVDLLLRRIGHEVAHQWWGHRLSPPLAEGSLVLVESLAKDAEQLVVAAVHGPAAVAELLGWDEDRYLAGRSESGDLEPTMARAAAEDWLYYGKGALMMHALRRSLGDTAVDRALSGLLALGSGPSGKATVLHLQELLLHEAGTAADSAEVSEWFVGRTTWDVRLDAATVIGDSVRLAVSALKQPDPAQPFGAAIGSTIVEVVLRDPGEREIVRGTVNLTGGSGTILLPWSTTAVRAVLDPDFRLIDIDRTNNQGAVIPP